MKPAKVKVVEAFLKPIPAHVNWVCANWKVLCAAPVGSFYDPAAQLKGK